MKSLVPLLVLFVVLVGCSMERTGQPHPEAVHVVRTIQPEPVVVQTTPEPAAKPAALSEGVYEVGVDIEPGKYKTDGPERDGYHCIYWRYRDDTLSAPSLGAGSAKGPNQFTAKVGEFVKLSGPCEWVKS